MKRALLTFPLFLVTLVIGVYFTYDPGYRHPVGRFMDSLRESLRTPARPSRRAAPRNADVYGEYGGSDREPVIRITPTEITDVQRGEVYAYRLVSRVNDSYQNRYLVEIEGLEQGSKLRNFMSLRFSDDGWVSVQGYSRIEDVDVVPPTARYELSRTYRFGN